MVTRKPRDLAEACVREALIVIDRQGVEALSLRAVARRLRVSHQAPYKHYASRNHLLAEVVRRAYDAFAAALASTSDGECGTGRLRAMGQEYLRYARAHPLQYRLMFGTPLPDPSDHPAMRESAQQAFGLLHEALASASLARGAECGTDWRQEALYVWATLHGLASILHTRALATLDLPAWILEAAPATQLEHLADSMRDR